VIKRILCVAVVLTATACSGGGSSTDGTSSDGGGGGSTGTPSGGGSTGTGADGGGSPGNTGATDAGGGGTPGSADGGASGTEGGTGTDAGGGTPGTSTNVTGTLGPLGPVKPIVSSFVISNSGETLIYLSSAPLTCATMQASRWLGGQPAGSQVIELVMKGKPAVGQTVSVPPGEANYAAGGKSSAYETSAASGSLKFTRSDANGVVEGSLSAKYADGSSISGTFHAEFCANGQQF
jgi:hypothetical protein